MERKIGEIFKFGDEWYQCLESNGTCVDCVGFEKSYDFCRGLEGCTGKIFKKIHKTGKPFSENYPDGKIVHFQRYECYQKPIIDENIIWHWVDDTLIDIEIKQDKEDMEEEKDNVYIVYKHISPTGREYVGMTRNIKKRWEGNGCSYTKNSEFRNDIMKYGWDNFQHLIIKDGLSLSEASKLEDDLIVDAMNRGVAYNIARGGIGGSHPAWNKGIPLNEEQKTKLAAANKGKKLSDETKRKIGEASRNHIVSEETKRKIGDKNRGKKHSKEHMEKWVESNRWRFCKIEIKKDGITIGVYKSKREAARDTGLSRGFIDGAIKRPNGKHQGYTIIILD